MTYFCTNLFKTPTASQINLKKNTEKIFLLLKKLKNTENAQLWKKVATALRPT